MIDGSRPSCSLRPCVAVATVEPRPPFERFFERTWPSARRLAVLLTGNPEAGEDVAQEALARLYSHWDDVDHPDAYLRRTIANLAVNRARQEQTRRTKLPLVAVPDRVDPVARELTDVIAGLADRQRAVIVLRYYAGLSETDIAEAIGCPAGTVKSLASRALARMAAEIER